MIRFNFNEEKAVEVVAYIAQAWPGVTAFYLSKIAFFADRNHLRAYGRPVTGDAYIAMANGPVPSRIYDIIKGDLDFFGAPEAIVEALAVEPVGKHHEVRAKRAPKMDLLSETDVTALDEAIAFCKGKKFHELSDLTHREPAWLKAPPNGVMDLELLVPEDMREEVREAAAYGVL